MVVVMDNLSSHKVGGVRGALERAGCRLEDLPPYSPDFNPIEQAFSKFKRLLRRAAARTVEGVYGAMKDALGRFAAEECLNYIRRSVYPHATPFRNPL